MKILRGQDFLVAMWAFKMAKWRFMLCNTAVGILDDQNQIVGAILFTGYNGNDVEVHFYGPNMLTRHILRVIAHIAVKELNVSRMTIKTNEKGLVGSLEKFGAVYEGRLARFFGSSDDDKDAAHQFALFRTPKLMKFAGLET